MKEKLKEVKASTNVQLSVYRSRGMKTGNMSIWWMACHLTALISAPGDKIEQEIIPELQAALNDKIILPNQIKNTGMGAYFYILFSNS